MSRATTAGKSLQMLAGLIDLDRISVIAIGNGTASRETEALVAELIQTLADTKSHLPM